MLSSGRIWASKSSAIFLQVTIFQGNGVYFAKVVEGLTCEFIDLDFPRHKIIPNLLSQK